MQKTIYLALLGLAALVITATFVMCLSSRKMLIFRGIPQEEMNSELTPLLNDNGQPSQPLQDLLNELDIEHDGTLANIVEKTQKAWLRPTGKERWEIPSCTSHYDKNKIIDLFKKLGYVEEHVPLQDYYDYAIIHGGLVTNMRVRLAYLINLYHQGIRFGKIIFLSGQRLLDPGEEAQEVLLDKYNKHLPFKDNWNFDGVLPKNEYESARFIFEQAQIPEDMKKIETIFVNALGKVMPDGSSQRPTTEDTVREWLSTNPLPGSCLAISHQPYVQYQQSVLMTLLPDTFSLDTAGEKSSETFSIELYLDTIARHLYQEHKRLTCLEKQN